MSDPGSINPALELYWGGDKLSLLLSPGLVQWDPVSGTVLENRTSSGVSDCDFLSPTEAFNATTNILYSGVAFGAPEICVLNFASLAVDKVSLITTPEASRIQSMSLNPAGTELAVSFENANLRDDSTQYYNTTSFDTIGSALSATLGEIVGVGNGFELYLEVGNLVVQPTGGIVKGLDNDARVSADGSVLALSDEGMLRLIALPEVEYIGEVAADTERLRALSADGTVGAFVFDDRLDILTMGASSGVSAIKPPISLPRPFAGTLTIDGVAMSINGTCDTKIEEGIGPVLAAIEATDPDGNTFSARGVGLAPLSALYIYRDGDVVYQHSWIQASNFMLENPEISTDGTSISGSTLLYTYSTTEFVALVTDTTDATGFATRSMLLDGVCSG